MLYGVVKQVFSLIIPKKNPKTFQFNLFHDRHPIICVLLTTLMANFIDYLVHLLAFFVVGCIFCCCRFDCCKEDAVRESMDRSINQSNAAAIQRQPPPGDVIIFSTSDTRSHESCTEGCVICLDDFKDGDECRVLRPKCNHMYHKTCIDLWLTKDNHCPLCRGSVRVRQRTTVDDLVQLCLVNESKIFVFR